MLVLTRSKKQRVFIGENIFVDILEIKPNEVRIGIGAPKEVFVVREEAKDRFVQKKQNEDGG